MKLKVVIYTAEEDGFWAEIPAISGCATQGETYEELLQNIREYHYIYRTTFEF